MWNTILTLAFSLLGGITVMAISFFFGFVHGRITAEKILDEQITNLRDEYAHTDGGDPHDYCIMIRTVKEIKRLI